MRRKQKTKLPIVPDYKYSSEKVAKLINYMMYDGEKTISEKNVYGCMDIIIEKAKVKDPIAVLELALSNTAPNMEVRSKSCLLYTSPSPRD